MDASPNKAGKGLFSSKFDPFDMLPTGNWGSSRRRRGLSRLSYWVYV